MNVLELFSGTESFSKEARKRGFKCFTVDNEAKFNPSLVKSVMDLTPDDLPFKPDIVWASPPCNCFSVAIIGKNWDKHGSRYYPKNQRTRDAVDLLKKTLALVEELKPKYFILENPRGMMRKMDFLEHLNRTMATYCQYGDTRQKPTDLWTNFYFKAKSCRPRASCHVSAPRGSRTGTQGLANSKERAKVPPALCGAVLDKIQEKEVSNERKK